MNLKKLRKNLGLTQEEVASKLCLARSTYRNYENNEREPNIDTLIKIADFFDVSLDYLCDRQNKNLIFADSLSDKKKELIGMIKDLNDDETLIAIGFVAKLANKPINEVIRKIKGDI